MMFEQFAKGELMRLSSLIFVLVHSLCLTTICAAQGVPSSRPGCPEKCGNVTVPYPFGIGPECSADTYFAVVCNDTFNPPRPFLNYTSLEALEFSVRWNTVRVMQAASPLQCSSAERNMSLGKSIVGSPFTFSRSDNTLFVWGCNINAWVMDSRTNTPIGGCSPFCIRTRTRSRCNGINCCQIRIPPLSQEVHISYKYLEQSNDIACGLVFMADYMWLSDYKNYSNPLNTSLQYAPVTLDWDFRDISVQSTRRGVRCENSTTDYLLTPDDNNIYPINNTQCYCKDGFEGNPYLPEGGCKYRGENNQRRSTIIGISSGTGALLLLGGAWMSSKVIRKRIKANRKKKFFKRNGGLLLEQQVSPKDGSVEKIKLFNSKELALATDRYNENRILGRGGHGTVYKGMLQDGRIVAVKKSKRVEEADTEVFINEVVILSQINHRNVVKLLGCCLETEVPLLVYEFIPNGTLFERIHDRDDESIPLSWKMRLRIATEVAGALSYLHNAASVPIYHRDIKSTNILLDDKYRAKVSDFGTSRSIAIDQTHLTTRVLGTFGYLDPEYFQSSQFTEKSDVYSFGVVIVELLTGEKAISAVRAEAGKSLATHFLLSMEESHLFDILDPEILKEGPTEEIVAVARLAKRCLNLNGRQRPTMKEVAVELEGIQILKEGSALQSNLEDIEFDSIDISEVYDFPSTSDSTSLNVITAESSESPLLSGKS